MLTRAASQIGSPYWRAGRGSPGRAHKERPRSGIATGLKKYAAFPAGALTDFWFPKGGWGGPRARPPSCATLCVTPGGGGYRLPSPKLACDALDSRSRATWPPSRYPCPSQAPSALSVRSCCLSSADRASRPGQQRAASGHAIALPPISE
jgi:hypothetical protein